MDPDPYIEVPFKEGGRDLSGWDCWGVCWYVAQREFGKELPLYADQYRTPLDYGELRRLIDDERSQAWREVPMGQEAAGDVLVVRMRGLPIHVGLVIGGGRMLHCEASVGTVVESYEGPLWKRRILGVYRYDG